MQRIVIKNLGPIREVELDLTDFLVLIGPQAGGKSTIAKAVYYAKSWRDELSSYTDEGIFLHRETTFLGFCGDLGKKFLDIFGGASSTPELSLRYEFGEDITATIVHKDGYPRLEFNKRFQQAVVNIINQGKSLAEKHSKHVTSREIEFSEKEVRSRISELLNDVFKENRDHLFIPASRSLLERIPILAGVRDEDLLDLLGVAFVRKIGNLRGRFLRPLEDLIEREKQLQRDQHDIRRLNSAKNMISGILKASYKFDKEQRIDQLFFAPDEYVTLNFASSGQQESLWMLLSIFMFILQKQQVFLAVEEPEAHLYPEAQKIFIDLMGLFSSSQANQWIITTHSPYILSALNNLLYAHMIGTGKPDEVNAIIQRDLWIDPKRIQVFFVDEGRIRSIVDKETGLIRSEEIDSASATINRAYDKLFDLDED